MVDGLLLPLARLGFGSSLDGGRRNDDRDDTSLEFDSGRIGQRLGGGRGLRFGSRDDFWGWDDDLGSSCATTGRSFG